MKLCIKILFIVSIVILFDSCRSVGSRLRAGGGGVSSGSGGPRFNDSLLFDGSIHQPIEAEVPVAD